MPSPAAPSVHYFPLTVGDQVSTAAASAIVPDVIFQLAALTLKMDDESEPGVYHSTVETREKRLTAGYAGFCVTYWCAALLPGEQSPAASPRLIGYGWHSYALPPDPQEKAGNDHASWVSVFVDPAWRRRGIGREIFRRMNAALPPERTEIWAEVPICDPAALADYQRYSGMEFARAMGLHESDIEHIHTLSLPVDHGLLADLDTSDGATDTPRVGDIAIETYLDGVPRELAEPLCALYGAVEEQAPSGDREVEATTYTVESYYRECDHEKAQGRHTIDVLAVHRPAAASPSEQATADPTVCGFSSLTVPADPRQQMNVTGTLVWPAYRGRKLGWALKVASIRAAQQFPHPGIVTENSQSNGPMVAINRALGFKPTGLLIELTGPRIHPDCAPESEES